MVGDDDGTPPPLSAACTDNGATTIKRQHGNSTTVSTVATKTQMVFDAQSSRDKVLKLQSLLTRAHAYSKFLADRLHAQLSPQAAGAAGFEQPTTVTGTLRGYQLEGVQWLVSLYENGLNGILADEMGLGKTVQCITFLAFLREQGVLGPFLIVAPLSTLANWMSELARWAPSMPALMYHGSQAEREAIRRKHLQGGKFDTHKLSVVVTSYEIAMRDARYLAPIKCKYLIIDEGHRLKNFNCRLIRELKAYQSDNRLLITGTPLQNNLAELWSLLNFLLPEIFTNVDDFLSWFDLDLDLGASREQGGDGEAGDAEYAEMVTKLHSILKPLLLRRLKADVETELPCKREYVLTASLSSLQREYYQAVLEGRVRELTAGYRRPKESAAKRRKRMNYAEPDEDIDSEQEMCSSSSDEDDSSETEQLSASEPGAGASVGAGWSAAQGLQNRIMQLRKVCNHPYLFQHPTEPSDPSRLIIDESLVEVSGKMRLLDQLLRALLKRGHKVLIFSQMSRMLDILGDYLELRGWQYSRIDGSVAQPQRQVEMQRFNDKKECRVFLLSTRAGGLGVNLVAADTVIFYDSDWNPQMDLQAQDRVHRIGQTKPVLILRLSTVGTAEDRMLQRAASKRKLERLVIHKRRFKGRQQLMMDERLLKEELEEILRDDEGVRVGGRQASELSSSELAMILDRSEGASEKTLGKSVRLVETARRSAN